MKILSAWKPVKDDSLMDSSIGPLIMDGPYPRYHTSRMLKLAFWYDRHAKNLGLRVLMQEGVR